MSDLRVPCVEGLFSEMNGAAVIHGSKCMECDTPYFPKSGQCHNPDCDESRMEACDFGGRGVLWCYWVAEFASRHRHKYDEPFKPYVIGVVDMENGLRLVGQMVDSLDQVKIGALVKLVIEPLYHEDDKTYTTWKFKQL